VRLPYWRAAELFTGQTGHTLHELRHSALTHAAKDGWSTPMLMVCSRHKSVASLAKYAKPSPEDEARRLRLNLINLDLAPVAAARSGDGWTATDRSSARRCAHSGPCDDPRHGLAAQALRRSERGRTLGRGATR
jgi:hypothetical protein